MDKLMNSTTGFQPEPTPLRGLASHSCCRPKAVAPWWLAQPNWCSGRAGPAADALAHELPVVTALRVATAV
jgi:hypothetical protein